MSVCVKSQCFGNMRYKCTITEAINLVTVMQSVGLMAPDEEMHILCGKITKRKVSEQKRAGCVYTGGKRDEGKVAGSDIVKQCKHIYEY